MSTFCLSLFALQVQTSGSVDRETLLVIFVGIIAFFFLALIVGLLGGVIYAMKLKRDVVKSIDALKATVQAKAYPVVASTNEFIREMTPKVKSIADDAVEISHTVRAQVTDLDSTLSDVTAKARAQADRVNGMVSSTLEKTSTVASAVEKNVKMPFREVAGIVAGIKTGWQVLTRPTPPVARGDVQRAARHVASWEDEIVADAHRAAEVNRSPVTGVPEAASRERSEPQRTAAGVVAERPATEATRSLVEAGKEVSAGVPEQGTSTATVIEPRGGRTL